MTLYDFPGILHPYVSGNVLLLHDPKKYCIRGFIYINYVIHYMDTDCMFADGLQYYWRLRGNIICFHSSIKVSRYFPFIDIH